MVGVQFGYFKKLSQQIVRNWPTISRTPILVTIILATLLVQAQQRLNSRFTCHGRKTNLPAIICFGVVNGILETFQFVGVYELGYNLHPSQSGISGPSRLAKGMMGLSLLLVYLAAIHAMFWAPKVFPEHHREDAPPFHTHALPALVVITLAMIGPYILYSDLTVPCIFHIYADISATAKMKLPGPFHKVETSNERLSPGTWKRDTKE
jgi:hypothetical protein